MFPWLKRRPPTPRTKPAWIDRLFKRRSTASSPPARPGASLPPATSGGLLNPAPQGPDLLPLVIFEAGDFFVPGVLPEEPSTRLVQSLDPARGVLLTARRDNPNGSELGGLGDLDTRGPYDHLGHGVSSGLYPHPPGRIELGLGVLLTDGNVHPNGFDFDRRGRLYIGVWSDSLGGLYLYTQGWVNKGGFPPGTTIKHVPNLSVAVPTENRSLPTLPASSSTQAAATPTTAASDPFAGFEYKWVPHSSIHVDSKNVILGEGQATVRLGEMLLEGVWTSVALKFMPLSEGRQFRKELELISLLNELNVPGIVKLFGAARDFATSEGRFHLLVLARANGKDLGPKNNKEVSEATTKGDPGWLPFNWSLALDRMVSLLETLVGLERLGIGHFDVKPDNLLLAENGSKDVILCDFGTAKPCKIGGTLPAGTVAAGTPGYRSPELLRLESYGAKADVFAAGATFYFLVERKNLFVGGSSPEQSLMTLRGVNVSTAFASDKWKKGFWAPRIAALIMGMVNPDPDDRLSLSAALSAASFLRSRIFKEPRWWDRRVKTEARRKVQDLRLPTSDQRLPDWVIDQFKECAAEGAELPALTDRELDGRVLSPAPAGQEPTTPRAGPAEQPVEAAKSSPRPLDGAALPTIRLVPPTPPRSTATTIPQLGATQGPLADQSSSTPASQPVVDAHPSAEFSRPYDRLWAGNSRRAVGHPSRKAR
ncbi:hypothetical protein Q8F55_007613 [Vanrija albida]|uniref:Protein kinase domain-containing protein n=1 Tax=Vanrija albida TaxID=181172 RepID=A0ABR3PV07_9TREE